MRSIVENNRSRCTRAHRRVPTNVDLGAGPVVRRDESAGRDTADAAASGGTDRAVRTRQCYRARVQDRRA